MTRRRLEAAFFSAGMLAATTCWVLFDVVERLLGEEREAAIEAPILSIYSIYRLLIHIYSFLFIIYISSFLH